MYKASVLHMVIFAIIASTITSFISGKVVTKDSKHVSKRAMDSMYKGFLNSFKTSFVPGAKKEDGSGDTTSGASPSSDWKSMIPGFAKGFIPDSAEGEGDNSTTTDTGADGTLNSNVTETEAAVALEGSFKVKAEMKESKETSVPPESTVLPEVLSTDDNVPSEYGLLTEDDTMKTDEEIPKDSEDKTLDSEDSLVLPQEEEEGTNETSKTGVGEINNTEEMSDSDATASAAPEGETNDEKSDEKAKLAIRNKASLLSDDEKQTPTEE